MHHVPIWTVLAMFLLAGVGCNSGPVAPVLSNSRVYQNPTEGFRFLVPEGWIQTASSTLPPGELRGEIFVVRYALSTPESGANFQVVCLDDTKSINMETHHAEPSFGVEKWDVSEGGRAITVNGTTAERIVYTARMNNRPLTKVVTCFRRNGRVYSFIGVFSSSDENAKQELERANNDVIWGS